ncbi:hypothetical protein CI109_101989 [Kwoniella shandongensis]|uniref:Uncharacterized protein n=1 Tax=Kwoniella shandongensis TaxID=1734106 RepID=A0A5M6BQF0_9TREE|nr:uncharacterized protein CI109_006578 [Kwoniella shandongensis]KAA5525116.1 hypothetical protein CI109_006578 [Kwoniella shandongensis]
MSTTAIPPFSSLPLTKPGPPYNAWGLNGPDDELGRLNLITPEAIKRGKDTITEGIAINLNLPLGFMPVHASRKPLTHEIKCSGHSNDDELSLNTQSSTQWDGFRHYPYQDYPEKGQYRFYGGLTLDEASDKSVIKYGIHNFARKPITSQAHLLDIPLFLSRHSLPPLDPHSNGSESQVSLSTLKAAAEEFNVHILPGDILIVRTGYTEGIVDKTKNEREALKKRDVNASCGVAQGEEVLKWHWEKGIAAVASDCPAYESWPSLTPLSNHQVFLGGWGMPIGELFDLRELAKKCEELGRWTFFLTSMVLNVEGGIASPPNAQAIL